MDMHQRSITEELLKKKPRDNVLRPLSKATFSQRRMFIQNKAVSVTQILEKYPLLHCSAIVSYLFTQFKLLFEQIEDDMSQIVDITDIDLIEIGRSMCQLY